jgi:hypothetical protein
MAIVSVRKRLSCFFMLVLIGSVGLSCTGQRPESATPSSVSPSPSPANPELTPAASLSPSATPVRDKWSLWTNGTLLRGANIYQRRVFPELDGPEFYGPGPFGPPYTADDFNRLSALGANFVNISTAGLFTIEPPYNVDEEAAVNLDRLLEMAAAADLFAVITFRTGPGRSEFAITGDENWPPENYIVNTVWTDQSARQAWAEMWHFAAERYRDNPIVIGYDLMCEPNSNAALDIWDAEAFYANYSGSGYDWNAWYPDIVSAIRAVDASTPILVGGNNYSSAEWLPYLQPANDPRRVYTIHQYSPHEYTHQEPPSLTRTYPGSFDTNYDGQPDAFDRDWLENLLSLAADFSKKYNAPVAVNEYGAERWEPGAADYVRDEMDIFEQHGWNYATWQWEPAWPPLAEGDNSFNFRFGPDPENHAEVENTLLSAYASAWMNNTIRPSNFGE